jgi:hypothetical protein
MGSYKDICYRGYESKREYNSRRTKLDNLLNKYVDTIDIKYRKEFIKIVHKIQKLHPAISTFIKIKKLKDPLSLHVKLYLYERYPDLKTWEDSAKDLNITLRAYISGIYANKGTRDYVYFNDMINHKKYYCDIQKDAIDVFKEKYELTRDEFYSITHDILNKYNISTNKCKGKYHFYGFKFKVNGDILRVIERPDIPTTTIDQSYDIIQEKLMKMFPIDSFLAQKDVKKVFLKIFNEYNVIDYDLNKHANLAFYGFLCSISVKTIDGKLLYGYRIDVNPLGASLSTLGPWFNRIQKDLCDKVKPGTYWNSEQIQNLFDEICDKYELSIPKNSKHRHFKFYGFKIKTDSAKYGDKYRNCWCILESPDKNAKHIIEENYKVIQDLLGVIFKTGTVFSTKIEKEIITNIFKKLNISLHTKSKYKKIKYYGFKSKLHQRIIYDKSTNYIITKVPEDNE